MEFTSSTNFLNAFGRRRCRVQTAGLFSIIDPPRNYDFSAMSSYYRSSPPPPPSPKSSQSSTKESGMAATLTNAVYNIFSGFVGSVQDILSKMNAAPNKANDPPVETEYFEVEQPLSCEKPLPCIWPQSSPKKIKISPKKSHEPKARTKNRSAKHRHELLSDIMEQANKKVSNTNKKRRLSEDLSDVDEVGMDCVKSLPNSVELNAIPEEGHVKRDFILMQDDFPQLGCPVKRKNEAFVIVGMDMVKYTPSVAPFSPLKMFLGRLGCRSRRRTISEQSDDIVFFDYGNCNEAENEEDESDYEDESDDDDDDIVFLSDLNQARRTVADNYSDDDDDEPETEEEEETDIDETDGDTEFNESPRVEPQLDSGFEDDRTKKHVKFNLKPRIHVIRTWDFASRAARVGKWEELGRDRARFHNRINNTNTLIGHIFDPTHRSKIYAERFN